MPGGGDWRRGARRAPPDERRAAGHQRSLEQRRGLGVHQRRGRGRPREDRRDGAQQRSLVVDPADGRIPYQPWARARKESVLKLFLNPTEGPLDPQLHDWPSGVPRNNYRNGLIQILQTRDQVVFLYENQHEFRIVPLDGRQPLDERIALWMGSSRGRWEGSTRQNRIPRDNHRSQRLHTALDHHLRADT